MIKPVNAATLCDQKRRETKKKESRAESSCEIAFSRTATFNVFAPVTISCRLLPVMVSLVSLHEAHIDVILDVRF